MAKIVCYNTDTKYLTVDYTASNGNFHVNGINGYYSWGKQWDATKNLTHTMVVSGVTKSFTSYLGSGASGTGCGFNNGSGYNWDIGSGFDVAVSSAGTVKITMSSSTGNGSAGQSFTSRENFVMPVNYTVSYNANGGTSTPGSQTVSQGNGVTLAGAISHNNGVSTANETITLSYNANGGSSTPGNGTGTAVNTTTTTYSFANWRLNSTSGTAYSAGAWYVPTANCTMYASWSTSSSTSRTSNPSITTAGAISRSTDTISSYTVSYNANGGNSTPGSQTATKIRTWTFGGWNTNSSGTGSNYNASTSYTWSSNTTLYAKWSSSESGGSITLPSAISRSNGSTSGYTVSYNANGGSGAPSSQTSGNRTITYSFSKWAEGSTGGTTYSAGATYTPSSTTTMYATWTSSTSSSSSWTCSSTKPTRTGYTFKGWSTSSGATTATYQPGETYTITSGMTLYAVWQINYYYLDLAGRLDGVNSDTIYDFGTCDVYINGSKVATGVTDYYAQHPYGSSYEFKNITPDWGCGYKGVYSGSVSGTLGVGGATTRLSFVRYPVVVNANQNGSWEKGIVWVNVNGVWKKARALNIKQNENWKRLEKYDFTL